MLLLEDLKTAFDEMTSNPERIHEYDDILNEEFDPEIMYITPHEPYYPIQEAKKFIENGGNELWELIEDCRYIDIYDWSIDKKHQYLNIQHPLTGDTMFHKDLMLTYIFSCLGESILDSVMEIKNFMGVSAKDHHGRGIVSEKEIFKNEN